VELFIKLEAGYLTIAIFVLAITAFVTTREFMPKGSFKRGIGITISALILLIALHFKVTIDRIESVTEAFNRGDAILCENRLYRKGSQSVEIIKSRDWSLEDNIFSSPNFERGFFIARCVVK